ncbi:response regulator [Pseudomonas sp. NPDC007930]|uniref:response regulator n=1 Tax=Pseudomonas sp. NPDC007930 TaxID=3364417 RepID=UPI0036E3F0DB
MNKVLVVDDHPVIRLAVRMLMERHGYDVVAETDNGADALRLAREHQPGIVILDICIPRLDGLEVVARLTAAAGSQCRVLVLTSQPPGHFSMRCMQSGAAGYVCKQQDLTELLSAVKAVLSGYSYFPNQALHALRSSMGSVTEMDLLKCLSRREMSVLQQLAVGKSNKEIAEGMFLSNKTVSTYKTRLLTKLNAKSLVELIDLAQRNEIV